MERNKLKEEINTEELFTKQNEEYLSEYRISGDRWWVEKSEVIPSQFTSGNTDSDYEVDFSAYLQSDELVGEVVIQADNQSIELKQVTAAVGAGFEEHIYDNRRYDGLEELCEIVTEMLQKFKEDYYDEAIERWQDKV